MAAIKTKIIEEDIKKALKEHKKEVVSTLRLLLSDLRSAEKAKKEELDEVEIIQAIKSQIKKRNDAIQMYDAAGRGDLSSKEKAEKEILKGYLPPQMSEEEVRKIVKSTIAAVGAKSMRDMGRVMGKIMPETAGKADGALVSHMVKEELENA